MTFRLARSDDVEDVLGPGADIGRHTHGPDNEELYVIVSGKGFMVLDGEEFEVGPGDVILNRPGGTHGLKNIADAKWRKRRGIGRRSLSSTSSATTRRTAAAISASNCSSPRSAGQGRAGHAEVISTRWFKKGEVLAMIQRNEIVDGLSPTPLLLVLLRDALANAR